MKHRFTLLVALVIVGLLVAPFAASAQTAPPGGMPPGGQPPTMPQCNPYAVPAPALVLGGNQLPILSSSLPAYTQWENINKATTFAAYQVWRVDNKENDGNWQYSYVGIVPGNAATGACATPGDVPDIIFDPEMPSQAAAGPSFYRECQRVFDHLNRELSDFGFTALTIAGGCVVFLYYGAKATCLTFGPAVSTFLKGQAEFYYGQQMPIPGAAFESAWHRFNTALYMWCATVGVAKASPPGVYA